jgi:hypothetical protein
MTGVEAHPHFLVDILPFPSDTSGRESTWVRAAGLWNHLHDGTSTYRAIARDS